MSEEKIRTELYSETENRGGIMTEREICYRALMQIHTDGVLCHKAIKNCLDGCDKNGEQVNKPFIKKLVNGVTERYLTLCKAISFQAGRSIGKIKPGVRIVLAMGLYQAYYMNVPRPAACNESVKLVKKHNMGGLSGFVNGVLRRFFDRYESMDDFFEEQEKGLDVCQRFELRYSCPSWIVSRFIEEYGECRTEKILECSLKESKTFIYGIHKNVTPADLKSLLADKGICAVERPECSGAFMLDNASEIAMTDSFKKGLFIIQDISSMMAGEIIPGVNNAMVLDMCAAPGGKTIHAADRLREGNVRILACDISKSKTAYIEEAADRTGFDNIEVMVNDASLYKDEFSERFDLVIADLPCSGLGVIGRKPDIKYKTKPEDITELASLQRKMLENAFRYLKKGGYLVFSTCTLTVEENIENCEFILKNGLTKIDIKEKLDKTMQVYLKSDSYLEIIPSEEHDGFFAAVFRKPE